jgi:DNA modification methylase
VTIYYQRNGITLHHGDCAEVDIECDLLVTDPPYGQDFKSGRANNWDKIIGDDDIPGTEARLLHVLRSLRPFRHIYIFGNRFNLSALPLGGNTEIVWDKGIIGPGDLSSPWGPQHETITFAVYVPSKANRDRGDGKLAARLRKGSVVRSTRPNSKGVKFHPTEKPIDILRQFIESSSVMAEIVYDPFAGSGSTLIAAALEGRSAIGCELDERYCEVAAKRFESKLTGIIA